MSYYWLLGNWRSDWTLDGRICNRRRRPFLHVSSETSTALTTTPAKLPGTSFTTVFPSSSHWWSNIRTLAFHHWSSKVLAPENVELISWSRLPLVHSPKDITTIPATTATIETKTGGSITNMLFGYIQKNTARFFFVSFIVRKHITWKIGCWSRVMKGRGILLR